MQKKEYLEYDLSYLKINMPSHLSQKMYSNIWGRPFAVFINAKHQLDFDEYFPILPGNYKIFLDSQNNVIKGSISPQETQNINPKSIINDR